MISADESNPLVDASDIEGPLVDYKQKGHTAELLGHDSVEGTDCYKIKLTLKSGDIRLYYLDADSFIEIKYESQTKIRGAIQYTETMLGDYEQVGGVYFPFAIESGPMGSEERTKFSVEKIELDAPRRRAFCSACRQIGNETCYRVEMRFHLEPQMSDED